jgi:hypothetical protein
MEESFKIKNDREIVNLASSMGMETTDWQFQEFANKNNGFHLRDLDA